MAIALIVEGDGYGLLLAIIMELCGTMTMFINFLFSLMLSIIFSFLAPMIFFGIALSILWLGSYLPGLQALAEIIATQISNFLATFGSGTPIHGLIVICLTCSFVGALFDTYVYYRCQILRLDS